MKPQRLDDCKRAWELKQQQHTFAQIAFSMGYVNADGSPKRGKVARMVADYGTRVAGDHVVGDSKMVDVSKLIVDNYTDYPSARDINDSEEWADYLNYMTKNEKMLKIQFWPDMHMMDTSWQSVALALQIRRDFKPDVDLFLGDEFDFKTLSVHWPRGEHTRRFDAFKQVRPSWHGLQDILTLERHKSKKAMLGGNHTKDRVEDYANQRSPEIADSVIELFIDMARADNRVMWMGWTDEMWLGNFMIEHGERTGENASKNSLKDVGYGSPRVGAHTHSPSEAWNFHYVKGMNILRPDRYIVQSVTLPCMCNIIPAYAKDKKKSRWINGMGVAYVNLNGQDVHMHKVIFHDRPNGEMVAAFGSDEYRQKQILELEKVA